MLRTQETPIQRIGIIGSGRIANRFITEATLVSGVNTQGIYNPHYESAKSFADRWGIEAYANVEDFYSSVDVVYIASPHQTHASYIRQALEHEKHVLCEKPMCLKRAEAEELVQLAAQKNRILFEGIKTAYCPGFSKLLGIACSGMIGTIKAIDACFTKLEDPGHRELQDTLYGGSFTEMGSYCLLPILKLFGHDYEKIRFDSIQDEKGIDIYTKAHIRYPNALATATCGLGVKSEGKLMLSGTKGYIVAEAPWWKTTYFEVHYENPGEVERFSERFLGDGLRYEICDLLSMINGDTRREFKLTRTDSETMAGIMERFLEERQQ